MLTAFAKSDERTRVTRVPGAGAGVVGPMVRMGLVCPMRVASIAHEAILGAGRERADARSGEPKGRRFEPER